MQEDDESSSQPLKELEEHPAGDAAVAVAPIALDDVAVSTSSLDDHPTAPIAVPVEIPPETACHKEESASKSTATVDTSLISPQKEPQKEQSWTEIDESIGLSWTPELETEYAEAQRDFQLSTQASAVNSAASTIEDSSTASNGDSNILHFPSFAEWKERHLAANIIAGHAHAQAAKGAKKDHRVDRLPKHDNKSTDGSREQRLPQGSDTADTLPPQNKHEMLNGEKEEVLQESTGSEQTAITSDSQRILHPVPHAGTGDPLLDPLIALRDRTNYASFDCSATLIRSSKSTKFASAILSSKKDRYMLTPCNEKEKYVIIELCDEIQIDTIVLANLEFFSSMFKLFKVSGGTAYPESAGTWRDIGTFRASNARGMQVFRPPEPAGGGFYRYLRIDFMSHYGSEYYCPVSLLKVYGLTQLDAYRRDEDMQNRLAIADEDELLAQLDPVEAAMPLEQETVYLQLVEAAKVQSKDAETPENIHEDDSASQHISPHPTTADSQVSYLSELPVHSSTNAYVSTTLPVGPAPSTEGSASPTALTSLPNTTCKTDADASNPVGRTASASSHKYGASSSVPTSTTTSTPLSISASVNDNFIETPVPSGSSISAQTAGVSSTRIAQDSSNTTVSTQRSASSPAKPSATSASLTYRTVTTNSNQVPAAPARRNDSKPQVVYTHAHSNTHQPNESIYGTIMKRLMALEVNGTLSTAYVEEQSRMVWDTFRKIEDRLSSMEKSRVRYDQLLRRVMLDLELHRAKLEAERQELSGQLNVLSREMLVEKRLGIAQLLAIAILMVFVVLTRGSPSSPILNLAHPRSAPKTAFPDTAKSRRPRSLRDESLENFPSMDFRTLPIRERRGVGSGNRGGMHLSMVPAISRNTSVKRAYRTSNGLGKRPLTAQPFKRNGVDYTSSGLGSFSLTKDPTSLTTSAPMTASASNVTNEGASSDTEANFPSHPFYSTTDDRNDDLNASTATLRGVTPPLFPAPPKNRKSPVETLRRKVGLMQPRRAASLDGTIAPILPLPANLSTNGFLDRRKRFSLGLPPYGRDRSATFDSVTSASEDGEGNSKAWLSTSDDSGDEHDSSNMSILGSPASNRFDREKTPSAKSARLPPTPDPSDADVPVEY